ncbi:MAG: NAD(P)/FAD-dependent oxidoreductase [Anaerolineales bacterium]|nr:NAD(P)/FAD-dependent oxidoreductase [Anaerolineales bacterium]
MSANNGSLKHQVVIVGGGSAGITVAAHLLNQRPGTDVVIIEPSDKHYYQPLWTLVGGGVFPREESQRNEAALIPPGATWLKDAVTEFLPDQNQVKTRSGQTIGYEFLVVAPGIQLNWDKVKGLKGNVGKNGICSNYAYDTVEYTWECIQNLKSGVALFTQPSTPIKCGGAPQKIAYLAEDHFRRSGRRSQIEVMFVSASGVIFSVPKYAQALNQAIDRKGIQTRYLQDLVEVRPEAKEAVFRHMTSGEETVIKYDMIHITPPQGPPDFIKNSPLGNVDGWVDVNKDTLQHNRYPNIFGLGDASSLPTSKTGAAIRKQAPTVVHNLISALSGQPLTEVYNGYTSCPLVTGYGSLILAEFDYDGNSQESFPFNQAEERYSMYMLKKYGLPRIYWHGMLKGRL